MLRSLLATLLLVASVAPATAKDYRAERFDARIVAIENGALRVTETIVFRFVDGTFTKVFRKLPARRTDGIEFVSASMDGTPFTLGDGPGRINLRRNEGLHFQWQFAAVSDSTHTFEVTYIARGVAVTENGADVLAWRALPENHDYRIDSSTIELVLPVAAGTPVVRTRRVGAWSPEHDGTRVTIRSRDIGRNGWIETTVTLPQGTLVQVQPNWRQRHVRHQAYRDRLLLIGGGVVLAGLVLLIGMRQHYDSPPGDTAAAFSARPEFLPPAIAGALATNGRVQIEHALATLFDLASRDIIQINEGPKSWGSRTFEIVRRVQPHSLEPYEQAVLDTVFSAKGTEGGRVSLSKARSQLTMKFSRVRKAVDAELVRLGLIDTGRQQVRDRYNVVAVVFFVLAAAAGVVVAMQFDRIGPWLLALPAAFVVLGITALIFGGAHTPLSNDGVRRAAQWRAYRKHLRELPKASDRGAVSPGESPATLLPVAVALGLGVVWSKLFKNRGADLPHWFHALSSADANRAFVAFVGTGGAGAHGGSGVSGGGAAGGGASGAG